MVSVVVAMNRVDVVDLVVDLVDVDLDVDLVDVVSLSCGCIFIFWPLGPRLYFCLLAPGSIFTFWPPAAPAVFFPGCFWGFPVSDSTNLDKNTKHMTKHHKTKSLPLRIPITRELLVQILAHHCTGKPRKQLGAGPSQTREYLI